MNTTINHDQLRIGVVGLGRYVEIAHMPTYFESRYARQIDVAALCDVSDDRVREWQTRYGVKAGYSDYRQMLAKEKLDAVVIVTPDHLHTQITCDAIEAGCDVLVEKPLATDIVECDRIIKMAQKAKRRVITDFHKRHDPCHQEGRTRIVVDKKYGQVQFGQVWMLDTINVPAPGFFKSNFDAVKADIIFNNGANISFLLSWNLPEGAPSFTTQGLYLQFENGDMKIDTRDRGMTELSQAGYKTVNPMYTRRTLTGYAGYAHESIGESLMEFLELKRTHRAAYAEQERVSPTDRAGFFATLMAQATHDSLARGRVIKNGEVHLGETIVLNEYMKEKLGASASNYAIAMK